MFSIRLFDENRTITVSAQAAKDLLLEETVAHMHRDAQTRAFVMRVLQTPCTDPGTIAMRQAVLQDCIANAEALSTGMVYCRRTVQEYSERCAARYRPNSIAHTAERSGWILVVQDNGEWLLDVLRRYAILARLFKTLTLSSEPLRRLRQALIDFVEDEAYVQLCEEMAALSVISTKDTAYRIQASLSTDARAVTYRLQAVCERVQLYKQLADTKRVRRAGPAAYGFNEPMVIAALRSLHDDLMQVAAVLTAPFVQWCEEYAFFDFGMRYYALLTDKRIPVVWPTVAADGETRYEGLRDVYLTLHNDKPPTENAYRAASLTVITGANNSGKTVWMRAIGTAQLLAQAGLPLPAKSAFVRIRHGILTLYAADEKDSGRFEEECRLFSLIADTVTADDLVLLNEPFQSTVYAEAVGLLSAILLTLVQASVTVLLVTHLTDGKDPRFRVPPHTRIYTATRPYFFSQTVSA